jgi:hypothetical protein
MLTMPAALTFEGLDAVVDRDSSGKVNGVTANALARGLTFFCSANVAGLQVPTEVDIPVSSAGLVQGYSVANCRGNCSHETLVWTGLVEGTRRR